MKIEIDRASWVSVACSWSRSWSNAGLYIEAPRVGDMEAIAIMAKMIVCQT